jgi:hypothetical protein
MERALFSWLSLLIAHKYPYLIVHSNSIRQNPIDSLLKVSVRMPPSANRFERYDRSVGFADGG